MCIRDSVGTSEYGGALFSFSISARPDATKILKVDESSSEEAPLRFHQHCLLLDDSATNLALNAQLLRTMGFTVTEVKTGEEAIMAHKSIDSRLRVLGYGIDIESLESVAIPAIEHARDYSEVIVIDEIGKFAVESEGFVNVVRSALEVDKPTVLALHKKSRHPLLQDIRRRDDARILEVTPVNRALLPYKIHKLMRETY